MPSLKLLSAIVGVVSAILAAIAKIYDLLLPFYYAPEILLALSAIALVILGINMTGPRSAGRRGRALAWVGIAIALLAPLAALTFWWSVLRLPLHKRAEMEFLIQSGRLAERFNMPSQALDQYSKALSIDSRRLDIRRDMERLQPGAGR
jgi:hypothetical protein